MGFNHRLSTAVLLRVEPDGTRVYRRNRQQYHVAPATDPVGFYPRGGRRAMYTDKPDPRNSRWFPEAVRERRLQVGSMFQAVKPGQQHL